MHGYFTLSLVIPMVEELLHVQAAELSINYGIDRLRSPAPLPVGARFRGALQLADVTEVPGGAQIKCWQP